MTAEIAIMNMNGIALATDSAATKSGGHSTDKLFELSSHHPVGIMVSGKNDYLRAPWETFIKIYRHQLKDKHFDTLEQYVADFLSFIDNSNYADLPGDEAEAQFAFDSLSNEVKILASELSQVKRESSALIENEFTVTYFEHGEAFIAEKLKVLEKEYINEFTDSDFGIMTKKFDEHIDQMIDNQMDESLLNESWRGKIKTIVCSNVLKNFTNYSGLVFAGFGENELFPSVITVMIEGKINGKLKYAASSELSKSVDAENPVYIIPFSKENQASALMTGIDDHMEDFSLTRLETMFGTMEDRLIDKFKAEFKEDVDLEAVEDVIHNELVEVYQSYNQDVFEFKQSEYIQPLTNEVKMLSKKEMAKMAESFSHLTSNFVSVTNNVAVITKGDGFEWIK